MPASVATRRLRVIAKNGAKVRTGVELDSAEVVDLEFGAEVEAYFREEADRTARQRVRILKPVEGYASAKTLADADLLDDPSLATVGMPGSEALARSISAEVARLGAAPRGWPCEIVESRPNTATWAMATFAMGCECNVTCIRLTEERIVNRGRTARLFCSR